MLLFKLGGSRSDSQLAGLAAGRAAGLIGTF